jgi:hypothetical protein
MRYRGIAERDSVRTIADSCDVACGIRLADSTDSRIEALFAVWYKIAANSAAPNHQGIISLTFETF